MKVAIRSFFLFIFLFQITAFALPVRVTDDTGVKVTVLAAPKRIISAMPSLTEILFDLGLGDRIAGVTDRCNYPQAALKKKKIGGVVLNEEMIASLDPDIIFMQGDAQSREIQRLRALGMPVFVVEPHSLKDIARSVRMIGDVTSAKDKAASIAGDIENEIKAAIKYHAQAKKNKVLVVFYGDPLVTAGKGTFIDDAVNLCGGYNIGRQGRGPYPVLSLENVISQDPDFILVAGKTNADMDQVKNNFKLKNVKAIRNGNIMLIDSDIITRPTPRLVRALKTISEFINKGSRQ